jgi:UDP-N-acetyl-D-glucosamine dehydrogenase
VLERIRRLSVESLVEKYRSRTATVAVVGLGYVGLPLVRALMDAGFKTIGLDIDERKIGALKRGDTYLSHLPGQVFASAIEKGRFYPTLDFQALEDADAILVCVPTPLTSHREPDLSFVENTARSIVPNLRRGQLVVLESTSYPGTTRDVFKPILEQSGLLSGEDFFIAYSPEREDPGNAEFTTKGIPKVVSGDGEDALRLADALYSALVDRTVPVSSLETAEAVKITENIFRAVNIALVNELKMLYAEIGIDLWEVIEAAKTKPFGYMPFYPGPGLGGHCIPIDPLYLSWKLKTLTYRARFIELAGEINSGMPDYVCEVVADALNEREKSVKGSRVLVVGVSYKRDVEDVRESPALDIIKILEGKGARVGYNDPYVPELRLDDTVMRSQDLLSAARAADVVVIVTDHSSYPYPDIVEAAAVIVDTRNATKGIRSPKIVKI